MRCVSFGMSDLGNRRRNNEDRFIRDDRLGLYMVCDGMGGAAAGEVASGTAASHVYAAMMENQELLASFASGFPGSPAYVGVALKEAIEEANARVHAAAQQNPDLKGMGTTLTALVVGGDTAVVGHVGDSRAYHWHAGSVKAVTQDHTWLEEQVRLGKMTADEADRSSKQNLIMRAVGIHPRVKVDIHEVPVGAGDHFLLCSDGLHGYLTNDTEAGILMRKPGALRRRCLEAVGLARERGGKDNITVVLVDVAPAA